MLKEKEKYIRLLIWYSLHCIHKAISNADRRLTSDEQGSETPFSSELVYVKDTEVFAK